MRVALGLLCAATAFLIGAGASEAQSPSPGFLSREEVIHLSPAWTGERFADGRPKVADAILDRMRNVTLEQAWGTLRAAGFNHQYEDGWLTLFPDKVLVGRALTAQWMPGRPDLQKVVEEDGRRMGRQDAQNAWPVDMLQPRDVYVADHFGLKQDGPSIGDNVGNAIYARTGNGIVYDGAVRDIEGLKELPNFVAFVRSYDPSHHFGRLSTGAQLNSTMVGINGPTHIGKATVMPGDVVLGRDGGILFIPAQLAARVVQEAEEVRLADMFGHQRLREKKYTAGQIDTRWTPAIEADFIGWLKANRARLPVPGESVDYVIRTRPQRVAAHPGS